MLEYFTLRQRLVLYTALAVWAVVTVISAVAGYASLFGAMGSFALCISFVVFLTDRYMAQEARRHWDSQVMTQTRMMWRYFSRIEGDHKNDPTPLSKLYDQVSGNFDELIAAKAEEKAMETYRYELVFTVVGTLQWGFGAMLIKFILGR